MKGVCDLSAVDTGEQDGASAYLCLSSTRHLLPGRLPLTEPEQRVENLASSRSWGTLFKAPTPLSFSSPPPCPLPVIYREHFKISFYKSHNCDDKVRRGPSGIQPRLEQNPVPATYYLVGLRAGTALLWTLSFPIYKVGRILMTPVFL